MSDRYPAGFYDQQQQQQQQQHHQLAHHPHHTATMSHYPPQPYRSGYTGYHPYHGYSYGSSSASYMPNYYRYAPYASPHYSQHHQGMFTPAGQQLIPSSVLHYPPRAHPYHQQQHQQQQQQSQPGYEPPAPLPYSSSASYQSRGFGGYAGPTPHYAPPGRSSTPAPNRTVLPPSYLEPLRSYSAEQPLLGQQQPHLGQQQLQHLPLAATPKLEDPDIEVEAVAESPAQRLTTSPPMISATGTDSGISNCSTRARSDSSQSTPVYSGEYPVNMSVESASCVPYHCPADGRDFEDEEIQPAPAMAMAETRRADTPLDIPDDISATSPAVASDKVKPAPPTPPEVAKRAEINLQQETGAGASSDAPTTPQDAGGDPIIEAADEKTGHALQNPVTNNWSPTPRRPRTPPAPQNSPVGFGQNATVPPALAPLLQQQQQQQQQQGSNLKRCAASGRNRKSSSNSNSICVSSNNRIIECDLIPSKKSKRKAAKKEAGESENMEPIVREQIRDIKPLPGFLQAFGSTEIGRFSERFLQTPESLVERLAEEYTASAPSHFPSHPPHGGYIEPPATPTPSYYPFEEQNQGGYPRNRMRGYGYEMPDYMAYERYAAYGAGRPRARYGEIRCNGY
ncbi:ataxin-2 homolog isoform X2 [Drosophila gunungcola]|uniref:ataxin-2 homolog isoform X2 n=1 Tax=Drosophila gunungcola TaxID=103775 RepID=UPI0022E60A14|nr:ataxin-2 homolog isoform X2 [Drosophila gunungcola]